MRWMLLVAMLAAVVGAACGSQAVRHVSTAPSPTPVAFRSTVNTICRGFNARAEQLGTPRTWAQEVAYIDSIRPLAAAEIARLRTIKPPDGDAVAYQRLMAAAVPLLQTSGLLRKAAIAEDMHRFRTLAALSVRRQRAYDAIAQSIGVYACVGIRRRT
jgi:hypothetical protein